MQIGSWTYCLNPLVRARLARQSFGIARQFGRGRAFSVLMAACTLIAGRTPKHRIY